MRDHLKLEVKGDHLLQLGLLVLAREWMHAAMQQHAERR
jgi:hypothetical protein